MRYTKNNPLRVVTLCSGYDSQCLALNRLREAYPDFDYTLVAWSEWDPESSAPTDRQPAVVAHKALFPQWADLNLGGDMTKIDWERKCPTSTCSSPPPPKHQSGGIATRIHGGQRHAASSGMRDAVKVKRPKFLCLENVKAMVTEKFVGMFNLWQLELERLGYRNFAEVLNAKDYGVPQNRERIFLVSIRDDGDLPRFFFPQPFPLSAD